MFDPARSEWATHVLATQLKFKGSFRGSRLSKEQLEEVNLGLALECVPEEEIITATIHAYRNWNSQPDCDLILVQFDRDKVTKTFSKIDSPTAEMDKGMQRLLNILNDER